MEAVAVFEKFEKLFGKYEEADTSATTLDSAKKHLEERKKVSKLYFLKITGVTGMTPPRSGKKR
jgi:hypothetical protein